MSNIKYLDKECFCQQCGKSLGFGYKAQKKKYCSNKCSQFSLKKDIPAEWFEGENPEELSLHGKTTEGDLKTTYKNLIKDLLLEEQSHRCAICSQIDEWNGNPFVMILDHIDGDPTNHRRTNLRLICPICDTQLPTHGSKNRGRGRFSGRVTRAKQRSMIKNI